MKDNKSILASDVSTLNEVSKVMADVIIYNGGSTMNIHDKNTKTYLAVMRMKLMYMDKLDRA
jgi:hypothetical protein